MSGLLCDLEPYRHLAPVGAVDHLLRLAEEAQGQRFLHVNSTAVGGGVAEILHRLVPLMRGLGLDTDWVVIEGDADFFATTKVMHNALQGAAQSLTESMLEHYLEVNRWNAARRSFEADLVMIHDPQPAALIEARPTHGAWAWRCHIDLSAPVPQTWRFLARFVNRYDVAVVSLPAFGRHLTIPHVVVPPSIDPLSDKNRALSSEDIATALRNLAVPDDKPLLVQVSRFDRFKDPVGVIRAYQIVKREYDVRLVLAGGSATDDPEGPKVLAEVLEAVGQDPDVVVLDLPPDAHLAINALQRAATIVLQKSTREGFGLTVAEALWKGTPVIGGAVGGITEQIIDGVTGYTVRSPEEAAQRIRTLLEDPVRRRAMGAAGREHVRQRFLITRQLADYLSLLVDVTRTRARAT
ncbi:MAG: glycosyltransferase [Candidatus Rokubacteria bacterium]|nr:glycosyltransferase [Candidatus Rokubacteria bacterium]